VPTQRIKWIANTAPNIVAYEILKSDTGSAGPYTPLTQILHIIPGPNWSTDAGGFFYYDDGEISYRFYRIATLDRFGNRAEDAAPTPFQAGNNPIKTPTLHTLAIDENTGDPNNLQYVTQGGTPIKDARIRLYRKLDWDAKNFVNPVGTTLTDAGGNWTDPIFAQPGETYTVVFTKVNEFGPDTKEITV